MKITILFVSLMLSSYAWAAQDGGSPKCRVEVNNEFNEIVSQLSWQQDFYTTALTDLPRTILVTASEGNDRIMSLWVREKTPDKPWGMFSFVDLSSGREQYLRFYMNDGISIGVTCDWQLN